MLTYCLPPRASFQGAWATARWLLPKRQRGLLFLGSSTTAACPLGPGCRIPSCPWPSVRTHTMLEIPDTRDLKAFRKQPVPGKAKSHPQDSHTPTSFPSVSALRLLPNSGVGGHPLPPLCRADLTLFLHSSWWFFIPTIPTVHHEILTELQGSSSSPSPSCLSGSPNTDQMLRPTQRPLPCQHANAQLHNLQTWPHVTVSLATAQLMPSSH